MKIRQRTERAEQLRIHPKFKSGMSFGGNTCNLIAQVLLEMLACRRFYAAVNMTP